jgi:hypothetical protein
VPDAVVPQLELKGVEQPPLVSFRQCSEVERDLWEPVDQVGVDRLDLRFGSA